MAFIAERRRLDGSVGYQVRWRQDGRWQSDVFDTQRKAQRFRLDVEDAGNRWPAGWVPGVGYVKDLAAPTGRTAFLDFAKRHLITRTAVADCQMARYCSAIRIGVRRGRRVDRLLPRAGRVRADRRGDVCGRR